MAKLGGYNYDCYIPPCRMNIFGQKDQIFETLEKNTYQHANFEGNDFEWNDYKWKKMYENSL